MKYAIPFIQIAVTVISGAIAFTPVARELEEHTQDTPSHYKEPNHLGVSAWDVDNGKEDDKHWQRTEDSSLAPPEHEMDFDVESSVHPLERRDRDDQYQTLKCLDSTIKQLYRDYNSAASRRDQARMASLNAALQSTEEARNRIAQHINAGSSSSRSGPSRGQRRPPRSSSAYGDARNSCDIPPAVPQPPPAVDDRDIPPLSGQRRSRRSSHSGRRSSVQPDIGNCPLPEVPMPPPAVDDFPPPPREPERGRRRSSVYVDPRNCPFPSEVSDPPPADERPSRGHYAQSSGRSRRPSVYDDTDYNPPVPDPPPADADKRSSRGRERNPGDDYAKSSSRSRQPSVYDDKGNRRYNPPVPDPPPAGPSRGDKYYPPTSSRKAYTMNSPHPTTTRRSQSQAPNGPTRHVDGSEYDSESRSRPTRRRGSIYAEVGDEYIRPPRDPGFGYRYSRRALDVNSSAMLDDIVTLKGQVIRDVNVESNNVKARDLKKDEPLDHPRRLEMNELD